MHNAKTWTDCLASVTVASSDSKVHYQLHSNPLMNQLWQDPSIWRHWIMPLVRTLSLLPYPFYKCWLQQCTGCSHLWCQPKMHLWLIEMVWFMWCVVIYLYRTMSNRTLLQDFSSLKYAVNRTMKCYTVFFLTGLSQRTIPVHACISSYFLLFVL